MPADCLGGRCCPVPSGRQDCEPCWWDDGMTCRDQVKLSRVCVSLTHIVIKQIKPWRRIPRWDFSIGPVYLSRHVVRASTRCTGL